MTNARNAPVKHYRKDISLIQALRQFGDDAKAEAWFPTSIPARSFEQDAGRWARRRLQD